MTVLARCTILDEAVAFRDGGEVLATLARVAPSWSFVPLPPGVEADPPVSVVRSRRGYLVREAGRSARREPTAVGAACTLVVVLVNRLVRSPSHLLCLHAAAVEAGGRTLVLLGTHRAGKSTLAAAMALRGHRLLADDVLPLDLRESPAAAVASGVLPRLRLPFPEDLDVGFAAEAGARTTLRDARQGYLDLPPGGVLPWGVRRKVDAFVLLERRPGADARLDPIAGADVTRALIARNFGRAADEGRMVDALERLAAAAPGFLLTYDGLAAAADLLSRPIDPHGPRRAAPMPPVPRPVRRGPVVPSGLVLVRRPGVERRSPNGAAVLIDRATGAVFALDPLGDAIWGLLDRPLPAGELAAEVAGAFPSADRSKVRVDVGRFLADLLRAELLVRAGPMAGAEPAGDDAPGGRRFPLQSARRCPSPTVGQDPAWEAEGSCTT